MDIYFHTTQRPRPALTANLTAIFVSIFLEGAKPLHITTLLGGGRAVTYFTHTHTSLQKKKNKLHGP
jgi:hypothetical protein